jgi:hypothetical protein
VLEVLDLEEEEEEEEKIMIFLLLKYFCLPVLFKLLVSLLIQLLFVLKCGVLVVVVDFLVVEELEE